MVDPYFKVEKNMNRASFFLSSVLVTFFIGTFQTAHSGNFSLPRSQMGPLEGGKEMRSAGKKAFPSARLVVLPFQNAPQPRSSSVDREDPDSSINDSVNNLRQYGKPDPPPSLGSHQSGIRFDRCIDTDRCLFLMTNENNQRVRRIMVALFGTDIPHLRANCEQEKELATNAMNTLKEMLSEASQIEVYDHYKVGGKHMARVVVDGQDLSELLISQGLAAQKRHGRKNWCTD